ncbi:DUF1641 domain-containing protein [Coralloluteibacterium stylophorae]|uniref:DUF1641 domain-containing protein n=1 Tax=Coralloluteibacterium stylophorae TaxID=1776034 RepID=A0A8J7VU55_9GAMM|nr:DUF1641 domain-containing protein [Coralloluteibacterium stylophorae]MBS7456979.1 DUF1641 domain-containing protein [Coralloluteibacterium stylophorae]
MAEPLNYTPRPPQIGPTAQEELDRLVETLHAHGVLRFANDLVASNTRIAEVLANGLNMPGSRRAIQNAATVFMALSQIEPRDCYRVSMALKDGLQALAREAPAADEESGAPGVKGVYRMLHDEDLWRAVTPFVDALKAFAHGMEREVDKPISDFTGKPSSA